MPRKQTPSQPEVTKRRESSLGFHYFNLYQCCPRKFFIKYFCRIVPKYINPPLVLGSAFHEGKACFYNHTSKSMKVREADAIKTALQIVEESKPQIETEEIYQNIQFRVTNLLHFWIAEMGQYDLQNYKILYVEKQLLVPIAGTKYKMTIRPDTILQDRQHGQIYIMETKTSGFSVRVTQQAVELGDQATSYIFGAKKSLGLDVYGCIPDISYWNKNTIDVKNIKNERGAIILRDDYACQSFEKGVAQTLLEINQKAQAYRKGFDPWILFPRNSYYCTSFSTPCDYAGICYSQVEKLKNLPCEFKRDTAVRKITSYVEDSIAIL